MAIKVWNGSSWTDSTPKYWSGSSWATPQYGKVWNGSSWVIFYPNAVFNNADPFYTLKSAPTVQTSAVITINTNGTIALNTTIDGVTDNTDNTGPTSWYSPTTTGIGSSYETRLYVTTLNPIDTGWSYNIFGATSGVTSGSYTSWYALSSTRTITIQADSVNTGGGFWSTPDIYLAGTLYIRNTSTLAEISVPLTLEVESY